MSNLKRIWQTLSAVALVAALSVAAGEQADQKLAIVNVSLIFENYKKTADVQRKIDEIFKGRQNELSQRSEALMKKLRALGEALHNPDAQTPKVFDDVQGARREQFHFKRDLDKLNFDMQEMYTKEMREVLTDIRVAIRTAAEHGGFHLVLRSPDTDDPATVKKTDNPAAGDNTTQLAMKDPRNVAEMVERFNRNPVLFGAQPSDITQEVLKKLNDDYQKRFNTK